MAVVNVPTRLGFQTVVVATDFSDSAERALACASAIVRRTNGKVFLAHVMPPEGWQLVPNDDMHPALCKTTRAAEKKLAALLKSDLMRGIDSEVVLQHGEFCEVLAQLAYQRGADMLIVSTHGRKGLRKLLFGSRVEEVRQVAPCPIILIGPKTPKGERKFDRVLFPTDLSALSLGALPVVLAFAEQQGSLLRFVRVLPETAGERSCEFALAQIQSDFGTLVTQRVRLAFPPEFIVELGPPVESILKMARDWGADLIAMGSHRPGTLTAHLPGSLMYDIVCDAHCPVLTICD